MPGALDGLLIVEVGDFISAAYCTKLLADLGADVLKIEPPAGDSARRYGPFRDDVPDLEASGLFIYLNTNKQGLALDLANESARELLDGLLRQADVLVENVEHTDLQRLGLDFATIHAAHPDLVVTSISTFGRAGPHAHFRGHGLQASAGSTVAHRTGDPARSPLAKPLNEPELLGGLHAAAATLIAIMARDQGAGGQHIDISIQDILASVTSGPALAATVFGGRAAPGRTGNRVAAFFPWCVLPVADGFMEFITMQERHWRHVIDYIGNPEWAADPRFADIYSRVPHAPEIEAHMVAAVGNRTRAELWADCRKLGVSFQPVHRIDDIMASEQLADRQYFVVTTDGQGRDVVVPGAPYSLSDTPWALRTPAPRLGEHTVEVLRERLGLDDASLATLCRAGAIL
jgi:crotonobetainyl-CoA:carnitine CoA-transferase CaiB-like acyl-CoA transferase